MRVFMIKKEFPSGGRGKGFLHDGSGRQAGGAATTPPPATGSPTKHTDVSRIFSGACCSHGKVLCLFGYFAFAYFLSEKGVLFPARGIGQASADLNWFPFSFSLPGKGGREEGGGDRLATQARGPFACIH